MPALPVPAPTPLVAPAPVAARQRRARAGLLVLAGLLALAIVLGAGAGALAIPPGAVLGALLHKLLGLRTGLAFEPQHEAVLWAIRLPRVLLAVLMGAVLGLSGAATQGLFRNPLADPSLLGISAGAALAAVAVIVLENKWLA